MLEYTQLIPYLDNPVTAQGTYDNLVKEKRYEQNCLITGGEMGNDFKHLLVAKYKVLGKNSSGAWVGPLVERVKDDPALEGIMAVLYPMLDTYKQFAFCHDSEQTALMVDVIVDAVVNLIPEKESEITEDVERLTGGKMWSNLSVSDVQNAIDKNEDKSRISAIETLSARLNNDFIEPAKISGKTVEELRANIKNNL